MLILTRRIGETVVIDDNITITILGMKSNQMVRIGINAPKDVTVHREEIYKRIQNEKLQRLAQLEEQNAEMQRHSDGTIDEDLTEIGEDQERDS